MKFILGKKQKMSQIFSKDGEVIPVTIIKAGPCFITQIKSKESQKASLEKKNQMNNCQIIQIGFEKLEDKKVKKPQKNKPYRYLREFSIFHPAGDQPKEDKKIGDEINVSIFEEGEKIKVSGISKGKGFQGVVKRHGFKGGPATHGHRHDLRRGGSIGSAFPERVVKGRKMSGQTGAKRVTTSGLRIAKVDSKNNLLMVKGAIPGPNGGFLEINS